MATRPRTARPKRAQKDSAKLRSGIGTPGSEFQRLVDIMARLRGPDGCPWDREQTPQSLRGCLLEETYEVLDALDRDDVADLRDELGDLLLQIVMQAAMASEADRFTLDDVVAGIIAKMT